MNANRPSFLVCGSIDLARLDPTPWSPVDVDLDAERSTRDGMMQLVRALKDHENALTSRKQAAW